MRPRHRDRHPRAAPRRDRAALAALAAALIAALAAACSGAPSCDPPERVAWLPRVVRESSGVDGSHRTPGVLWTHDDSGGRAEIYAVDASGALRGTVAVTGATNHDWEDLATAPCADGSHCLYIGDIGNNQHDRDSLVVYRVPEPAPEDRATAKADNLPARWPDRQPRDAEALFVLPGPRVYVVTKGVHAPVAVFRYPFPLVPDSTVTLEEVQRLTDGPVTLPDQVTGAVAGPGGRWVVLRTYTALRFYHLRDGRLVPFRVRLRGDGAAAEPDSGSGFDDDSADAAAGDSLDLPLGDLAGTQGEGVGLGADGELWLTSEQGLDTVAPLARIRCRLP